MSKTYRVLFASDIHCTHLAHWYGVDNDTRMQLWLDSVLAEHARQPIDLLLFLGDYSLDFWECCTCGSWINEGVSTTERFFKEYVSQLPKEIPFFAVAGNHEQFGDEKWVDLVGNHRRGAVTLGNHLFIMLDTFGANLDPTEHSDGTYLPVDVDFVKKQMAAHPEKKVYLCAHHFDEVLESDAFAALTADERILGLFMGHVHESDVKYFERFHNKPVARTGNFSHVSAKELEDAFWGFRELILTPEEGVSRYIVSDSRAVVKGEPFISKRHTAEEVRL